MFYNQDWLLSREAGLKIVWLASTLGSENASAFRKLQKREIAAVDVSKTCHAVARPSQPLALRTSGHLMYGVVRVYNKQAEYWMNDVQTSYTSIRKLILQTSHGTVTTLGGIVLVGQDTSTIDMQGGMRRHTDNMIGPKRSEMYRNDLHFDAAEWGDLEDDEGDNDTARFVLTNDSLSMFGSSAYESERARDASFDLGLGLTPPPGQPFTAAISTTGRRNTGNLLHNTGIDTTFDMDMDPFDLPPLGADTGQDVRLDLGMDTDMLGAEGLGINAFLDDQQGFDLLPLDGDVRAAADLMTVTDQDLPPSSSQEGDGERANKRSRLTLQDKAIELSDTRIVSQREQYVERMERLRAAEALRRLRKDAEREAPLFVFGPAIDMSGTNMLVSLWTMGMDHQIAQMMQANGPQQDQERQKRPRNDGREDVSVDVNVADNVQDHSLMQLDDPDFDMIGGPQSGDRPRQSTPNEWEAEIGRAGLSSQTIEMPWNRSMTALGDTTLAGETTVGVSTRSFSIETPTGLRRQGRESSMSRTSIGGGAGRPTIGATAADGNTTGDANVAAGEDLPYASDTQAIAEQDLLHFNDYALMIRDQLEGSQPLFFSDLAPVSGSSPAVAARAFHHILSLSTSHRLSAKQTNPFGEIEIRIL